MMHEALQRLQSTVRRTMPGGCRILSQPECACDLCRIDATQEAWDALPWPTTGTVEERLDKWRSAAELRIQWLRAIGMDNDEILTELEVNPPVDVQEEQMQLDAALRLNRMESPQHLRKAVRKFATETTDDY